MNKKYKIWALWMVCLVVVNGFTFTACSSDDDNDTNQYKGGITLNVFGPSPVARGGELRFLGSGMDRVTAIVLPGSGEVTDIKVISDKEIRITVPQNAEEGLVVLKTPNGEITTTTPITYMEPISLDDFSPKSAKAGERITLTGEYLNLIKEVIFADEVIVTDFVSQSRSEIVVVVPLEAQTGQIIISDGKEIPNWIYSEEDLVVGLPTIESVSPNPLRAGRALTITGEDFYLVEKVILPGGMEIEIEDADEVIVIEETPEDIQEGAIILVAKSGVEVASEPLELIKPEIEALSGLLVKNNREFVIEGKNMDLVSEVVFQGGEEGVVQSEFIIQTATRIILMIPAEATDGLFTLRTLSETETAGEALVFMKPSVSSLSATTVKAKQELVFTGQHLDLITAVMFGEVAGKIESATETRLTVTIPVGAESGPVTLGTASGYEVVTTQEVTVDVTLPTITSIEAGAPGEKITVIGTDLDIIKTIYLEDEKGDYTIAVTDYGIKTATKLEFYHVLGAAKGYIKPMMVTFDGDEGPMPEVYCGGTDPVLDPSLMIYDFEHPDFPNMIWGGVGTLSSEDGVSGYYYEITAANWNDGYWWFANNYLSYASVTKSDHVLKMDVRLKQDVAKGEGAEVRMMISGVTVNILPYIDGGSVWTTSGKWTTIAIPMTEFAGLSDPTPATGGEWGIATWIGSGVNFTGFCIDNIRYEKIN